jgi:hypothetical protein
MKKNHLRSLFYVCLFLKFSETVSAQSLGEGFDDMSNKPNFHSYGAVASFYESRGFYLDQATSVKDLYSAYFVTALSPFLNVNFSDAFGLYSSISLYETDVVSGGISLSDKFNIGNFRIVPTFHLVSDQKVARRGSKRSFNNSFSLDLRTGIALKSSFSLALDGPANSGKAPSFGFILGGAGKYNFSGNTLRVTATNTYYLKNSAGLKNGDRIETGTNFFWSEYLFHHHCKPNVGIDYTYQYSDYKDGRAVANTDNGRFGVNTGLNVGFKKLRVSSSVEYFPIRYYPGTQFGQLFNFSLGAAKII